MGGNALKTVETRRYDLDQYTKLANDVIQRLDGLPTNQRAVVIPHIRDKQTFGDLDILYTTWGDTPFRREHILRTFSPQEAHKNGDVWSFNVNDFQVDLIHSDYIPFKYAYNFFSWNDCGLLLGRIFHQFGLKHGHRGLTLPLRDGDNKFDEVELTINHNEALKFIGLDPVKYNDGFNTTEEMFDYVASSPFYSPELYKLENLNTVSRSRDKKRVNYNKFLEYGERYCGPIYNRPTTDKSVHLDSIFKTFPHALYRFEQANIQLAAKKYLRQKFNGNLVSSITNLTGKQLGQFMQHLKTQFNFNDTTLMYLPEHTIRQNIVDAFEQFNYNTLTATK